MIAVFCDLGGYNILGKAREIADESGDRVIALGSSDDPEFQQKLIYLGADEVVQCQADGFDKWAPIISEFIRSHPDLHMVIFPSSISSNVMMGVIYWEMSERISTILEDADSISSSEIARKLDSSVISVKWLSNEKTTLVSLKRSSISEPFEDSSRFGKIRKFDADPGVKNKAVPLLPQEINSPSERLVILVSKGIDPSVSSLANRLAEKYGGVLKEQSGRVEVIYGPCIAIEVSSKIRELPDFRGDLISISSKKMPVNSIAKISAITSDLGRVVEILSN